MTLVGRGRSLTNVVTHRGTGVVPFLRMRSGTALSETVEGLGVERLDSLVSARRESNFDMAATRRLAKVRFRELYE